MEKSFLQVGSYEKVRKSIKEKTYKLVKELDPRWNIFDGTNPTSTFKWWTDSFSLERKKAV